MRPIAAATGSGSTLLAGPTRARGSRSASGNGRLDTALQQEYARRHDCAAPVLVQNQPTRSSSCGQHVRKGSANPCRCGSCPDRHCGTPVTVRAGRCGCGSVHQTLVRSAARTVGDCSSRSRWPLRHVCNLARNCGNRPNRTAAERQNAATIGQKREPLRQQDHAWSESPAPCDTSLERRILAALPVSARPTQGHRLSSRPSRRSVWPVR